MRVVLLINTSWNAINFRRGLIEHLVEEGHHVTVIANKDRYTSGIYQLGADFLPISFKSRSINPFAQMKLLLQLFLLIRSSKPDVILTFTIKPNIYGSFAAKLLGVPVINNIAGLGLAHSKLVLRILVRFLYRMSLKKFTCFFQNTDDKKYFLEHKISSNSRSFLLPGSGVDVQKFKRHKAAGITRKAPRKFIFLLSARLLWSKGVGEYVRAAEIISAEYEKVEFWVIGFLNLDSDDSIPESQVRLWHEKGVIKYMGCVDDIAPILAGVDCFVLPTYYPEGTPRSLLEAAAMELPIITTDRPGCRDVIIDGETGFFCNAIDHEHLCEQMRKMLDLSPDRRLNMGQSGRGHVVRNFDERIVIRAYIEQILELAK